MDPLTATTSAGMYGSGAEGLGLALLSSLMSFFLFPLFFIILAYVLYYFTGEKKRADEFMPKLMSQLSRVFVYMGLFVVSLVAYGGLNQVFNFVFQSILPEGPRSVDPDSLEFTKGVVMLALMGVFAAALIMFNRFSTKMTKVGGTVSTKTFLGVGLATFGTIFFVSTISLFNNLVDYIDNSEVGISAGAMAGFFTAASLLAVYVWKVMEVLRTEGKR